MDREYATFIDRPGMDGWVGGLMDEYARAAVQFCAALEAMPEARLKELRASANPECVSVQAVCIHVVQAAHDYERLLARACGKPFTELPAPVIATPAALRPQLAAATRRTEAVLHFIGGLPPEQQAALVVRPSAELPLYVDMLVEHAIVHLLRHRRQLERW